MPIFALETSTERLSLAIIDGGHTIARAIDAGQRHSELAIAAIADLFAEATMAIADVDVIAFGQGPGSFVGVRIACGLAQGMALGAGKKLIPVPTQMALAEQALRAHPDATNVLVAIDARMNEIYLAAYQRDSQQRRCW
jgi:tRNA threonylcarbamoyladenosine biosynthesis protein TsaB